VKPWIELGRAQAPGGGVLTLHQRDRELVIRVDGHELMSSRLHGSEDALATIGCAVAAPAPVVLIGGLGMGFTLRAALDVLPARAKVVIAELSDAVVAWNRGPLAHLAGDPLSDRRVTVATADVRDVMRGARFDAILLDVDNSPHALTAPGNAALYSESGLVRIRQSLRPGGRLAVWSAVKAPAFERRLRTTGYRVEVHPARARGASGGASHYIYVGDVAADVRR
jgi:spermidine synthase